MAARRDRSEHESRTGEVWSSALLLPGVIWPRVEGAPDWGAVVADGPSPLFGSTHAVEIEFVHFAYRD